MQKPIITTVIACRNSAKFLQTPEGNSFIEQVIKELPERLKNEDEALRKQAQVIRKRNMPKGNID